MRWFRAFGWGFLVGAAVVATVAWQLRRTGSFRVEIVAERGGSRARRGRDA